VSLINIKDYLVEYGKTISEEESYQKYDNERIQKLLDRSIDSQKLQEETIKKQSSELCDEYKKIEELNRTIAYLNKYIILKKEYEQEYDSLYGSCCAYCDGNCSDQRDITDEEVIDLNLKEQAVKYLENIIKERKNDNR
jgi:hypothetical protein